MLPAGRLERAMTTTSTQVFDVPDISCDHCKRAIEEEVAGVEGVETVDVDVAAKTVRVAGAPVADSVVKAIRAAGYDIASAR
jgi:copper chaperone